MSSRISKLTASQRDRSSTSHLAPSALSAIVAITLIFVSVATIAGCGGGSSADSGATTATDNSTDFMDGGVLRYGLEAEPTTLNPSAIIEGAAGTVSEAITESLYFVEPDGTIVPNLAKSGKHSANGRTWTFELEEGVRFSTGARMTAQDVVFSIDQGRKSPYNGATFENISGVRSEGQARVVISLKKPSSALPAQLSSGAVAIIPNNFGGMSEKAFSQDPVGTGPFELAAWHHGQSLTVKRNKYYWKAAKLHLSGIEFLVVTDETSRFKQLQTGGIDMFRASPLSVKTTLPPDSPVRLEKTGQLVVNALILNQDDPAFEDPRMREAINLAINREGIIATATNGEGQTGASFLPPVEQYSVDLKPPAIDLQKATKLVNEAKKAGANTGFTINSYDTEKYAPLATQIIQQNLEEIGLAVKLEPLDEAALNEKLAGGEFQAALGAYYPSNIDPSEITGLIISFFGPGSGANVAAQSKLASEAASELSGTKRQKLYAELQQMVVAEKDMIVVNYQPITFPVAEDVSGIQITPVGSVFFGEAGFTK
jgi:peptide/nickel transport system substrate-binding protein